VRVTLLDGTQLPPMSLNKAIDKRYVQVSSYQDGMAGKYGNYRVGFELGKFAKSAKFSGSNGGVALGGGSGDSARGLPSLGGIDWNGNPNQGAIWTRGIGNRTKKALNRLQADVGYPSDGTPGDGAVRFVDEWWGGRPHPDSDAAVAGAMSTARRMALKSRTGPSDPDSLTFVLHLDSDGTVRLIKQDGQCVYIGSSKDSGRMKEVGDILRRSDKDVTLIVDGGEPSAVARTLAGGGGRGGGKGPEGPRILVASGGDRPRSFLFHPEASLGDMGVPFPDPSRRGRVRIVGRVRFRGETALLVVSDTRRQNLIALGKKLRSVSAPGTPPASAVFTALASLRKSDRSLDFSQMEISVRGSGWVRRNRNSDPFLVSWEKIVRR